MLHDKTNRDTCQSGVQSYGIPSVHTLLEDLLQHTSIPWSLASVTPEHVLTRTAKDCYRIDYVDQDKRPRWTSIRNQDFHAMGKQHLEKIIEAN
jgi:hypothetical protein